MSMSCNEKISIRKESPGTQISSLTSGLNQTVEMAGKTIFSKGLATGQSITQPSPEIARPSDLEQRGRSLPTGPVEVLATDV